MASTIAVFLLDVSPGMAGGLEDQGTGKLSTKLDLCKEYICRKISPKIQGGRKTEHAGLITFGGDDVATAEAHDPADYTGVASVFPPQQAKAGMLSRVQAVKVGNEIGNPIAALIVLDEILRQHAQTKKSVRWRKEVFLMLDANAKLRQTGWEDVFDRLLNRGIILRVIGVNFDTRATDEMAEVEMKALPKVERFWRTFNDRLMQQLMQESDMSAAELAPALGDIFEALDAARGPKVDVPGSTLGKANLRMGDKTINPDEGIDVPIRYSKATFVNRPPTLKKVDKRAIPKTKVLPDSIGGASQSQGAASHSQMRDIRSVGAPPSGGEGNSDLQGYVRHFVLRKIDEDGMSTDQQQLDRDRPFHAVDLEEEAEVIEEEGGQSPTEDSTKFEEVEVDKENIVKAYKYGDQWIPIKDEDFPPMATDEGMSVLGFLQEHNYERYQSMGEVYYLWPDPDVVKSQLVFSSLVEAMIEKKGIMLVRWVQKANAMPKVGAVKAYADPDGTEYLCFVQLPFAEDERNFLFPSLTTLISKTGSQITEHKLLPMPEQQSLMDQLVDEMDLDQLAEDGEAWFIPQGSFNPAINRVKEAIYHLAINAGPVPPPHPALLKYTQTPDVLVEGSSDTVQALKKALDIKIAPPKAKKGDKKLKAALADEDVDLDALFPQQVAKSQDGKVTSPPYGNGSASLVGEDFPLKDFAAAIEHGGGRNVERALTDLGDVVNKMLDGGFASSKYKTAVKCLQEMRLQAIRMEEVDVYNTYIRQLRDWLSGPKSKKRDFWTLVEQAEPSLLEITSAEADAIMEG